MKQIQFTITEEEIRSLSENELSDEQVQEVLVSVENDQVLWNQIHDSIRVAMAISTEKKAK